MSIPEELARREDRLAKLAQARAKIEARATERFAREAAEHRAKLAAREAAAANGKKGGGRPPAPPVEGPQPKDQINLTDEDSRIMPVAAAPENPTPVEAMAWRLRTPNGKQLYGLRKQTPEPVFGIIKSVIGFRQFLLRGLDRVRGEWSLVTMAWNIKRMYALSLG